MEVIIRVQFFILSKLKKLYYQVLYGKRLVLEKNVAIDYNSNVLFKGKGLIFMGEGVHLRSKKRGYHSGMPFSSTIFVDGDSSSITIGKNSNLNGCYIHGKKQITIGEGCAIASGVNIIDSNGHKTISNNRISEIDQPEEIYIGNNVWIGLNAIILKGTSIGDNSIVGANSVVKGKFPANSLIRGNPAVHSKTLDI